MSDHKNVTWPTYVQTSLARLQPGSLAQNTAPVNPTKQWLSPYQMAAELALSDGSTAQSLLTCLSAPTLTRHYNVPHSRLSSLAVDRCCILARRNGMLLAKRMLWVDLLKRIAALGIGLWLLWAIASLDTFAFEVFLCGEKYPAYLSSESIVHCCTARCLIAVNHTNRENTTGLQHDISGKAARFRDRDPVNPLGSLTVEELVS